MATPLRFGQGHMSVGDSGEEFISIHALGRERLLVLSGSLPSHRLKLCFSSVLRGSREIARTCMVFQICTQI